MTACKALLIALCLSLAAGAADDPALALPLPPGALQPLPAAPRWLHKSANGSLIIKSATRGAQVAVDGRAVGAVPLPPVPVAPGRHQVKLSKPGFVSVTRRVQVVAGQRSLLAVDLLADAAPLPLPPLPDAEPLPSPSDALTALIAAPGASAAPAGPGVASAAPGVAPGALPARGAAPADASAAVAAAESLPQPPLVTAPAGVALAPSSKAPPAALAPAVSQPLTKKWWFWGGAAVGAAVLAAAVTWALPALYVERRDPATACGGTCGIVVNK